MGQSVRHSHQPTTLYDHIRELRTRFLVSAVVLLIAGIIVYLFYGPILTLLSAPLGTNLYYNNPAGGFAFIMKICLTGGLIIAIPVLVYNIIMFVRPAFEQVLPMKRVFITTGSSTGLAIAGAIFAYTIILPGALSFFAGFQISGLSALISADNYLNFVTNIIITFVIVFQIPLIMSFIDSVKPLPPKTLIKNEKWVVLGSLVIALIVPFTYDLVTSLLIALPIIVLYNLSIIIVLVKQSNAAKKARINFQATVIKSAPALGNLSPEISFNEQTFGYIADELSDLEKDVIASSTAPKHTSIDFKILYKHPEIVKPAAWVEERKAKRLALNKNVHVFSDISRNPRTNRVLA